MAKYDFSTLNSSDLEELVRDLLNANEKELNTKIQYRSFKEGKDKGVDFVYSSILNRHLVVGQVKHYLKSGLSPLLKSLKSEVEEIKKANPDRYIVATSVPLSLANKKIIQNIFHPYIKSLADIYGSEDLNMFLEKFPEIIDKHYKLWLSSSQVLNKILNYGIESRSLEFSEIELKRKLRLYVTTPMYYDAKNILEKNKILIIVGEPGVGKTTLAEMLVYNYIKENYKLSYIDDDVKEAEKVLINDDSKQILYFDDFLGHNTYEMRKAQGNEMPLLRVMRRVTNQSNKLFLLTTRTFILNTAIEESEKLRLFNLKAKSSILQLKEYSEETKNKLLFNHIQESDLRDDLKDVLIKNNNFIVNHKNFSPRSVEFITTKDKVENFSSSELEDFIHSNFDSPDEIWRHAYEQQISDIDRFLLNTMISFGNSVSQNELESSFINRLEYEVKTNRIYRPFNAFTTSLKRLENGFIRYNTDSSENELIFINHSLTDFLINYLHKNREEVIKVIESAFYLKQIFTRIYPIYDYKIDIHPSLKNKITKSYKHFIKKETSDFDKLNLIFFIDTYFGTADSEPLIIDIITSIESWHLFSANYLNKSFFFDFLKSFKSKKVKELITNNINLFLNPFILSCDNFTDFDKLMGILNKKYKQDIKSIIRTINTKEVTEHISYLLQESFNDEIENLSEHNTYNDIPERKLRTFMNIRDKLRDYGLHVDVDYSEYNDYDWDEISNQNYFDEQMSKDD